ncbi:MAG: hypothetical protein ACOC5T_09995 [Elusimicrobiota bacterium]
MKLCRVCKKYGDCLGICSCGTYHWGTPLYENEDYDPVECHPIRPDWGDECSEYDPIESLEKRVKRDAERYKKYHKRAEEKFENLEIGKHRKANLRKVEFSPHNIPNIVVLTNRVLTEKEEIEILKKYKHYNIDVWHFDKIVEDGYNVSNIICYLDEVRTIIVDGKSISSRDTFSLGYCVMNLFHKDPLYSGIRVKFLNDII